MRGSPLETTAFATAEAPPPSAPSAADVSTVWGDALPWYRLNPKLIVVLTMVPVAMEVTMLAAAGATTGAANPAVAAVRITAPATTSAACSAGGRLAHALVAADTVLVTVEATLLAAVEIALVIAPKIFHSCPF